MKAVWPLWGRTSQMNGRLTLKARWRCFVVAFLSREREMNNTQRPLTKLTRRAAHKGSAGLAAIFPHFKPGSSAQPSDAQLSQPTNGRRCEMNAAMNCGQATNLSHSFNPGCNRQESEAQMADTDVSRQSYFSICTPLPDMPSGNRFPYGICGPFLDEDEAFDALEALQAKMPKRKLAVMYGQNFFETPYTGLERDQELARAKLAALLTAE